MSKAISHAVVQSGISFVQSASAGLVAIANHNVLSGAKLAVTYRDAGLSFASLTVTQLTTMVSDAGLVIASLQADYIATCKAKGVTLDRAAATLILKNHNHNIKTNLIPAYNTAQAEQHGAKAKLAHYYQADGEKGARVHTTPPKAKAPKTLTANGKADDDAAEATKNLQPNANPSVPALADASADIYGQLAAGLDSGFLSFGKVITIIQAHSAKLDALKMADMLAASASATADKARAAKQALKNAPAAADTMPATTFALAMQAAQKPQAA